jgi:tetratricopeptide (TPR) repeat protein
LLNREKPDVVIFEMAERFLINFPADVMTQPTTDIVLTKLRAAGVEKVAELLSNLDINPEIPESLLHKALALIAANRFGAAEECLRQAIALQPDWKLLYYYLGLTLIENGQVNQAREAMEKATTVLVDPLHLSAPRKNKAAAVRAVTEAPDWGFSRHILAGFCMQDKDYAEALTHQRKAVQLMPSSPYAVYRMGQICQLTTDMAQAEHWFRKAVHHAPRFVAALSALAYLLLQQNRLEEAEQYFAQALVFSPHDAELPLMRGVTWLKRNNPAKAIEDFSEAVRMAPKLDRAYVQMGVAFRKMGQMKEAREALQRAVTINANNMSAKRELAAINP